MIETRQHPMLNGVGLQFTTKKNESKLCHNGTPYVEFARKLLLKAATSSQKHKQDSFSLKSCPGEHE
jgi:hypothetical protein